MLHALFWRRPLIPAILALAAAAQAARLAQASANDFDGNKILGQCSAIHESAARLRCFDEALRVKAQPKGPDSASSRSIGNWRLVDTPNPQGGAAAISIMRSATLGNSDPDFAGLMIRCNGTKIEVLLVVIPPFPLRARPKVTVGAKPDPLQLDGTVVVPGSAVLLPADATELARGSWQQLSKLTVEINHENSKIRGAVALDGLAEALRALETECQKR